MKTRVLLLSVVLVVLIASNPMATAAPTSLSYTFTASGDGDLTAWFWFSNAGYTTHIGAWVYRGGAWVALGGYGLNNQTSYQGEPFAFGAVIEGETLLFDMYVNTTDHHWYSYYTYNSDSQNHVTASPFSGGTYNGQTIPVGTQVGFEDSTFPSADWDYNDEEFVFAPVSYSTNDIPVPEPSLLLLLGIGLGAVSLIGWRFKA